MSNIDIIRTVFEFSAAVAVVLCFIFEKRLIRFENNFVKLIRAIVRTYKANKKQNAAFAYASAGVQSRAPSDIEDCEEEYASFAVINGGKNSERVA